MRSEGRRALSARTRITLASSLVAVGTAAITVAAVVVAMRFIPSYQFTSVTAVGTVDMPAPLPSDAPMTVPQPLGAVVVADPQDLMRLLLVFAALALVLVGGGGILGSWIVAGRVLQPLSALNAAARRTAGGAFDHRVQLVGADDEFREFGEAFDYMLETLERSFDANERFAANASHELRTPLATTKLLLDVARGRDQNATNVLLLERLTTMNDRTIHIVNALLDLADSVTSALQREPQDLVSVVFDVVDELAPFAEARGVVVESRIAETTVIADRVLLERVVANLVRNGIQHNHRAGRVWIWAGREPSDSAVVSLRIENTGPVVVPEDAAMLAEPFYRPGGRAAQPASDDAEESHGLGLALVSRIVDAHAGSLTIEPRTGGGLSVTVEFPD